MYVTLTGAVLGVTRTSLRQLLGAWSFAFSFRREALCCLDVAFVAAQRPPMRKHIQPNVAGRLAPRLWHRFLDASRSEIIASSRALRN